MNDDEKIDGEEPEAEETLEDVLEPEIFRGPLLWVLLIFIPIVIVFVVSILKTSPPVENVAAVAAEKADVVKVDKVRSNFVRRRE